VTFCGMRTSVRLPARERDRPWRSRRCRAPTASGIIPPSPPMNVNHLPSRINKGSEGDFAFGQSGHLRPKSGQLNPKLSHGQLGHVLVNRKSVTRTRHHGDYSLPFGSRDLREFLRNWKSANARQIPPLPASERNVLRRGISEPASRKPSNQG